eukprot:TRINITY_DN75932_c0_g1_i1.p1 TRINITY_DN75932_c0_g1~~TRINITY_DN75932_c0_g1_i1.p1  ORF type:complete len:322 (-),score=40.83 TRINITY_DN75932_c0_g1_i1:92-1057(-)
MYGYGGAWSGAGATAPTYSYGNMNSMYSPAGQFNPYSMGAAGGGYGTGPVNAYGFAPTATAPMTSVPPVPPTTSRSLDFTVATTPTPTKAADPTIYVDGNYVSHPCRAVLLFCYASGIRVNVKTIDMAKGEHRTPDYLKINPNGQVPSMVDGDLSLFESGAIIRYLARKYHSFLEGLQNERLYGKIQQAVEYVRQRPMDAITTIVFNTVFAEQMGMAPDKGKVEQARVNLAKYLDFLSEYFFQEAEEFLVGTSLSTADCYLAVSLQQLQLAGKEDKELSQSNPKIKHFFEAVSRTDAFKRAHRQFFEFVEKELKSALEQTE